MDSHPLSSLLLVAVLGTVNIQAQQIPIGLTLACRDSRRMTATLRNVGAQDTAVIFGVALANGGKYLVDRMTLQVATGSNGFVEQYHYHPRHYPSAIAGRVDDWIVPLPAGASYTLALTASDFIAPNDGRKDDVPRDARLSLRLPIRGVTESPNLDVTGLRLFRVWNGTGVLMSNELATSEHCH